MSACLDREEIERQRLNTAQAAHIAGVAVRTIQLWVQQGRIDYVRTPSGQLRIFADTLLRRT